MSTSKGKGWVSFSPYVKQMLPEYPQQLDYSHDLVENNLSWKSQWLYACGRKSNILEEVKIWYPLYSTETRTPKWRNMETEMENGISKKVKNGNVRGCAYTKNNGAYL